MLGRVGRKNSRSKEGRKEITKGGINKWMKDRRDGGKQGKREDWMEGGKKGKKDVWKKSRIDDKKTEREERRNKEKRKIKKNSIYQSTCESINAMNKFGINLCSIKLYVD